MIEQGKRAAGRTFPTVVPTRPSLVRRLRRTVLSPNRDLAAILLAAASGQAYLVARGVLDPVAAGVPYLVAAGFVLHRLTLPGRRP